MEQTKKFVLVDPRFVRPSMRDKALSALDTDISDILNSDVSDEMKAQRYISSLARFRNYSAPPKLEKTLPAPAPSVAPVQQLPSVPSITFKTKTAPKRPHKRVKVDTDFSIDPTLWRRTQRTPTKKKFGPQWLSYTESPSKKKKPAKVWIEQ